MLHDKDNSQEFNDPNCPEFDTCFDLKIAMSQAEKDAQKEEISNGVVDLLGGDVIAFKTEAEIIPPNGLKKNIGVAVATDNGYYYTWDGDKYVKRQIYQSAGIADGSVTPEKTTFYNDLLEKETMYNPDIDAGTMINGKFIRFNTGEAVDAGDSAATDFIDVSNRKSNIIKMENIFVRGGRSVCAYDSSKVRTRDLISDSLENTFVAKLEDSEAFIRITSKINEKPTIKEIDVVNKIANIACYVDGASGNDTNNGSKYFPFKTISKAVSEGYNIIYVFPRVYDEIINVYDRNKNKEFKILPYAYRGDWTPNEPDTPKIQIKKLRLVNCSNVYIENVFATNSDDYGFELTNCHGVEFFHCDCSNTQKDGFKLINVDGSFKNCLAYNIGLDTTLAHADGFNIHGYGDTQFINCVAHDCLDDGISHHDGCTGLIQGGEYYNCGKGGVASPTHGAQVNVYGVNSHDNTFGLQTGLEEGKVQKTSIIANNLFYSNGVGILANGYTLNAFNNILRNNNVATRSENGGKLFIFESNQ